MRSSPGADGADPWLDGANPADLDAVARALDDGRVRPGANGAAPVQRLGVGDAAGLRAFLLASSSLEARTLAWSLRQLARERRAGRDRDDTRALLVWTGHPEAGVAMRDTRAVFEGLCARAERHLLLSTYALYDGRTTLAPLAARMAAVPGLRVDLVVHISPKRWGHDPSVAVPRWSEDFLRHHWPAGVRTPHVWYDPRDLVRDAHAVMHAKCVVADERHALVTSANLTGSAQETNIEVGVLLDHPSQAQALVRQFLGLVERSVLRSAPLA